MIFSGRAANYFGYMTFNALPQSPACRSLRCNAGDKRWIIYDVQSLIRVLPMPKNFYKIVNRTSKIVNGRSFHFFKIAANACQLWAWW